MEDLSRAQIVALAQAHGLTLPPELEDDLVVAYGRMRKLVANLPGMLPRGQEPAHVFAPANFMPPGSPSG